MADRLTQLQDCLDQLATQFYASIRYITTHHPSHPTLPLPTSTSTSTETQPQPTPPDNVGTTPDSPRTFAAAQRELARDLVLKEQQIEYLIATLPGIGTSERAQEDRLRVLERELREAEEERKRAVREREVVLERLDAVIRGVRRV